jgi:hypothetical protein
MLVPTLVAVVLFPVPFTAILSLVAVLLFGFRYPVATAGVVVVLIPILDQAVADREFIELFGAVRLTPAVVLKAMMSLVIGSYLVRRRINPMRYRVLLPLLLWLAYLLVGCLTFHDLGLSLSMWFRLAYWTAYFVFFYVVAAERGGDGTTVRWLWRAGVTAVFIFAVSVHLAKAMGIGGDYYKVGESYGFYADPWNMAMTLPGGLALTLLYPWVFDDRRKWVKTGTILLSMITVLAAFFTMTRTSLIASLIAILVFTFSLAKVVRTRTARIMSMAACMIVVAMAFIVYRNITSTNDANQVSARWSEVDKGDIASGRLEVFYGAWNKFLNASPARKLVGHGIGAGPEAAEEFTGIYVYLHDDLLEMLICGGVIGSALYFWFFGTLYRCVLRGLCGRNVWAVAALTGLAVYNVTSLSYMRVYAVTPNTYFALAVGTSLGMLHRMQTRTVPA